MLQQRLGKIERVRPTTLAKKKNTAALGVHCHLVGGSGSRVHVPQYCTVAIGCVFENVHTIRERLPV